MFRPVLSARAVTRLLVLTTVASATLAPLVSCRDVTVPEQDPATATFAASLGIRLSDFTRDTSGVYYQDNPAGSGNVAVTGSTIRYYYTGYLTDGRRFGTNVNATATTLPDTFVVGQGTVIAGFDRGLLGVRAGGRRRLLVPPALGYGNETRGNAIPAGSVLYFIVDVPAVIAPPVDTTKKSTSRAR